MDDGTFVFILLFIGFKVEINAGINESSVPVWIFRMLSCLYFELESSDLGSSHHLCFCKVSLRTQQSFAEDAKFR